MGKPRRLAAPLLACPEQREAVQPEIGITPAATGRRPDSPPFPTRGESQPSYARHLPGRHLVILSPHDFGEADRPREERTCDKLGPAHHVVRGTHMFHILVNRLGADPEYRRDL